MKISRIFYFIYLLIISQTTLAESNKAIYGNDDRYEATKHPNPMLVEMATSVAAMVYKTSLIEINDNYYDYPKITLGQDVNLCPDQPYSDQYTLATCTGFLISDDLLLTAGHCVENITDCSQFQWVFDYTDTTNLIHKDNVFSCKKIIAQELKESSWKIKDYALIQLDRPTHRQPLHYRKTGQLNTEDELAIIGHPVGLPIKISASAIKQKWSSYERRDPFHSLSIKRYIFRTNLDSFAGNSGSPIINLTTGLVEGILISGARDFFLTYQYGQPCSIHAHYPDSTHESEETGFRVTTIKALQNLKKYQ